MDSCSPINARASSSHAKSVRKKRKTLDNAPRSESGSESLDVDGGDGGKGAKAPRACLNCRKQKMRCEMEDEPPCRRCRNSDTTCLFKVRANGVEAGDWYISDLTETTPPDALQASILNRLHAIETKLGIRSASSSKAPDLVYPMPAPRLRSRMTSPDDVGGSQLGDLKASQSLPDLWTALSALVAKSSDPTHTGWNLNQAEALWLAFAENMPALHFSTQRIFLDRPTPILLVSVLYAASMQHSLVEYAQLSPFYRSAAARAISELAIPAEEPVIRYSDVEDLHNALGIIITGLISEAWVSTTGVWIAMAYQLVLAGATGSSGPQAAEWRGLYEGLRVVDIEHASLLMACPFLPLTPPLPVLEQPSLTATSSSQNKQAWTHLTTIMHVGLSHFSGRHLPTIMETVLGDKKAFSEYNQPSAPSADDARMIKGWANELDSWLIRYHKPSGSQQRGPSEANVILLQYQLHELFALSIYHSVRGVAIAGSTVNTDRNEVVAAARGALQIQRMGMGVWSNWDLVIISLAAQIVLDCLEEASTGREDRLLVQGHINALRNTHQPAPNLRHSLAASLEARLQMITTPAAIPLDYSSLFANDTIHQTIGVNTIDSLQPFFMTPPEVQVAYPATGVVTSNEGVIGASTQTPSNGDEIPWWNDPAYATDGLEGFGRGMVTWPPAFQRGMGSLVSATEGEANGAG